MTTLICDCNKTMTLDGRGLTQALGPEAGAGLDIVHTLLCRREAGAFQRAAKDGGDELLVACTQESRLFVDLNERTEGARPVAERPIRFVNIRETGGWSKDAKRNPAALTPKIAALIALAQLPEPEPVPSVGYASGGRVLVIGPVDRAVRAAELLGDALDVTLLLQPGSGALPQARDRVVHAGDVSAVSGWLGAFEVSWTPRNPIDLDLCTRCNACLAVCPERAIDLSYRIDLAKCKRHGDCVQACGAAGAIDFGRASAVQSETTDLVLDLGDVPSIDWHQPPQGYFHAADDAALLRVLPALRGAVGEFEKPTFFQYRQKLCAHTRNEQIGCNACVEVCSAHAIRSDASMKGRTAGGGIVVEPHLCVGCGACSTVCPSGALTYATPRADEQGRRLRTLLSTYHRAGGVDAALLIHGVQSGARLIGALGRAAQTEAAVRGLPARVLPFEVWHAASTGIELWLSAIAYGASQVWVLMTDDDAPAYRRAVAEQLAVAQAILGGLGYRGEHLRLIEATDLVTLDAALRAPPADGVAVAARHAVQADKRATLDLALDHLQAQASATPEAIALPAAGSPFGSLAVDAQRCTMCLSCVSACPAAALADNPERPQLRFIEKNCVQCGLCARTCPEQAIALEPRLWLADGGKARRQPRVLNEAEPFRCVRCAKPFGTSKAVELMVAKLAGHAMFQGAAADRLKMCSDCRVIDLHRNPHEVRITDV